MLPLCTNCVVKWEWNIVSAAFLQLYWVLLAIWRLNMSHALCLSPPPGKICQIRCKVVRAFVLRVQVAMLEGEDWKCYWRQPCWAYFQCRFHDTQPTFTHIMPVVHQGLSSYKPFSRPRHPQASQWIATSWNSRPWLWLCHWSSTANNCQVMKWNVLFIIVCAKCLQPCCSINWEVGWGQTRVVTW